MKSPRLYIEMLWTEFLGGMITYKNNNWFYHMLTFGFSIF